MSRSNVRKRLNIIILHNTKSACHFILALAKRLKYITFTAQGITGFTYTNFKERNNEVDSFINNRFHGLFASDPWMRKK